MSASPAEVALASGTTRTAAGWLVTVGPSVDAPGARSWVGRDGVFTLAVPAGFELAVAESSRWVVAFSGVLANAVELDPAASGAEAARLALAAVERSGAEAFGRLRGAFAVLAWDRIAGTLLVARDQVGLEPIFYARAGRAWLFSSSPDVLVEHPSVSRAIDALALSEWICGWFPAVEDTAYRDVKRLPPATVLTVDRGQVRLAKYWDPFPEGEPVSYLRESELEQFDGVLRRAVARTMRVGPAAVLLSGGLDSITVAVTATEVARATGAAAPLALSLVFPEGESNEGAVQMGVAERLGVEQRCVAFADAVGSRGLLADALALSGGWPQPMWNLWAPAYASLARIGAAAGRQLLLTGRGGDEWLTISPYLLADLLPRGRVGLAWKLLRMRQRSNQLSAAGAARLVWLTAGRPLGSAFMDRVAPRLWHRRRQRRLLSERPDWVAPGATLRGAMEARIDRWIEPARPRGGFYQREARLALRHPAITHDMEETQEFGRRHRMRMLHPFWDVDLIELAHRVPPSLLMKDGRSKWLLRRRIEERLPGLGLERRGKVSARGVFRDVMDSQAPAAWHALGGVKALADIGVVRTADIESRGAERSLVQRCGGSGRLWTLLNLETWVRQRV